MKHVFISYSRKDTAFVEKIDADMRARGVVTWRDTTDIPGGARWLRTIEAALQQSYAMVYIDTPNAQESEWVERELLFAAALKLIVIPIKIDAAFLSLSTINLNPILCDAAHYGDGLDRLIARLSQLQPTTLPVSFSVPLQQQPAAPRKPPIDILPAPFDWCFIPAGKVTLREDNYNGSYIAVGKTLARYVDPFWMARYPVTNAQFGAFIDAKGYSERRWWTEAGWQRKQADKWTEPRFWRDSKWNGPDYPVVGVSYYEAVAFCAWLADQTRLAIRLPGEHEWQWAAQGEAAQAYPWGDGFDADRFNTNESKIRRTTSVRQYEGRGPKGGDSPFGVSDMAGNVWEWSATLWENRDERPDGDGTRVLRGGSWNYDSDLARAAFRYRYLPQSGNFNVGFRVCFPS